MWEWTEKRGNAESTLFASTFSYSPRLWCKAEVRLPHQKEIWTSRDPGWTSKVRTVTRTSSQRAALENKSEINKWIRSPWQEGGRRQETFSKEILWNKTISQMEGQEEDTMTFRGHASWEWDLLLNIRNKILLNLVFQYWDLWGLV